METWSRFDELLPDEPGSSDFDYVFYGYDAFYTELVASASDFREFMSVLLTNPDELSNPSLPAQAQRPATPYEAITIVGHSLGAVVIRLALLDLRNLRSFQLEKVQTVLFASAHRGAYLAKLVNETITPIRFLNLLAAGIKYASPLIDQLLPDSQELTDLRERTRAALQSPGTEYLVAKRVFIAKRENVVLNLPFGNDPPPLALDANHTSICKPPDCESECFGHLINSLPPKAVGAP